MHKSIIGMMEEMLEGFKFRENLLKDAAPKPNEYNNILEEVHEKLKLSNMRNKESSQIDEQSNESQSEES